MIPSEFKLLGHTIIVEFQKDLLFRENVVGESRYRENKIILQPPTEDHPYPLDQIMHNFCHELVHMMLYHSSNDKLDEANKDENAVEILAGLLMQYMLTETNNRGNIKE